MWKFIVSLVCLSFATGCGSGGTGAVPAVPKDASEELVQLRDLLVEAAGSPPLKKQSDLDQFANRYPKAVQGVASGKLAVVWGAGIKEGISGPGNIIGYETSAESQGGWVIRESSNIDKITAEEFKKQAPPKSTSKK